MPRYEACSTIWTRGGAASRAAPILTFGGAVALADGDSRKARAFAVFGTDQQHT